MRIALTSTTKMVELETPDGGHVQARLWEGTTDSGIPVHAFITRIAPSIESPSLDVTKQFDDELTSCAPVSRRLDRSYDARMLL
jgi:hypothetical protein